MKKYLIVSIMYFVMMGFAQDAFTQSYQTAVGARLGSPFSLSAKHFISETSAVEVYAGYRSSSFYSWLNISAAYQIHKPIESVEGLQWYYGGGASVFIWNLKDNFIGDFRGGTSFGLQGYLGLDYKFKEIPLNASVDWVPTVFFGGASGGFGAGYGALAVRYILNGDGSRR